MPMTVNSCASKYWPLNSHRTKITFHAKNVLLEKWDCISYKFLTFLNTSNVSFVRFNRMRWILICSFLEKSFPSEKDQLNRQKAKKTGKISKKRISNVAKWHWQDPSNGGPFWAGQYFANGINFRLPAGCFVKPFWCQFYFYEGLIANCNKLLYIRNELFKEIGNSSSNALGVQFYEEFSYLLRVQFCIT